MSLLLGVDTGGTYTDAVLIQDERTVIASAKSLTTRTDLALGIGRAVAAVLEQSRARPDEIGLASLSTTLATNALVEGQGGRVALVFVGFTEKDIDRAELRDALKGDPVLLLSGGHDHTGTAKSELDEDTLCAWLETVDDVSGFAVASIFSTRNPVHENRVAEIVRARTGRPVSCSHHLSARLNGPKRALTAVLNARLIGMIDRLIGRAQDKLGEIGIHAPLMVVRGDGALISAELARQKPIETILSGPAASIVGAQWMTGAQDALVSDIGGTTTDVALLRNGRPKIDPAGARVGQFRTMVEAVAMRTTGLGGDSQVHFVNEGLQGGLILGPQRVLPVSLIAHEAPDIVMPALEAQSRSLTPGEHDARFVRALPSVECAGLSERDQQVLDRIGDALHPVGNILRTRIENQSLARLVQRGIVQVSGVTPSDASHVLGTLDSWNRDAARLGLEMLARRRTGAGNVFARSAEDVAQMIVDQLTKQTSMALLETAFAEEGQGDPLALAQHYLIERGLTRAPGLVKVEAGLAVPVIGLGASATTYYPAVGQHLHCEMVLPEHAGVANAVGAVVGRVTIRHSGTVTSPSEGKYRVHGEDGPQDFTSSDAAMDALESRLGKLARVEARQSGAEGIHLRASREVRHSKVETRDVFIEATITVEASGRPGIAHPEAE